MNNPHSQRHDRSVEVRYSSYSNLWTGRTCFQAHQIRRSIQSCDSPLDSEPHYVAPFLGQLLACCPKLNKDHENGRVATDNVSAPTYQSNRKSLQNFTYAAVAPRASNGLDAMANDSRNKKTRTNAVMTPSFMVRVSSAWRIQMGVMSIVTPMVTIKADTKWSIRLSE